MQEPTRLRSDNDAAISWAEGEKLPSKRAKHIDVGVHFIRDLVDKEKIQVGYVPTEENDADMMTKPLGKVKLREVMDRIGVKSAVEEEC